MSLSAWRLSSIPIHSPWRSSNWAARAMTAGIALVEGDDAERVGEFRRRIDRRRSLAPHRDHRLEPRRRKGQDRKAPTELLVMDMRAVMADARHVVCSPVRQSRAA
jgi:hypothetical protein